MNKTQKEFLRLQLHSLWDEWDATWRACQRLASDVGTDVYSVRDTSGNLVIVTLLETKSRILAALTTLEATKDEPEHETASSVGPAQFRDLPDDWSVENHIIPDYGIGTGLSLTPSDYHDLQRAVHLWNEYQYGSCSHPLEDGRPACEMAVSPNWSIAQAVRAIITRHKD